MPRRQYPPGFIRPCAPELREVPPVGANWLHELKHDGYRLIARRDVAMVNLWTRTAIDWTARFGRIARAVGGLPAGSVTLDGEAVVLRPDGNSDFYALRNPEHQQAAVMVVFDILELDGEDLRGRVLEERRDILARLLDPAPSGLLFSQAMPGDGATVFRHACAFGLEGIVSKRLGSKYKSGPSYDWVKCLCPGYRRRAA
jgi:bifunctional non-homologous end joining protein LigD